MDGKLTKGLEEIVKELGEDSDSLKSVREKYSSENSNKEKAERMYQKYLRNIIQGHYSNRD